MTGSDLLHTSTFSVNSQKITLSLVDINRLYPHEEVHPEKIENISKSILKIGFIKQPIPCIKVGDDYIVLDGHHRLGSLKLNKFNFVPVQIVEKESIILKHWYHVINNLDWAPPKAPSTNKGIKIGTYKGKNQIENHLGAEKDEDLYKTIKRIYHSYGINSFYRQDTIPINDNWIQYDGVTLDMIIKYALDGNLMPPGISKFDFPYRVLNLDVPLDLLKKGNPHKWEMIYKRAFNAHVYDYPVISVN